MGRRNFLYVSAFGTGIIHEIIIPYCIRFTRITGKQNLQHSMYMKIFSLKNFDNNHKQLIILGIKITLNKSKLISFFYKPAKIKQNKIVFNNFQGGLYGCNPKYIAEEIIKRNLQYDLVWLIKDIANVNKNDFPKNVRLVKFSSFALIKELLTTKILIGNVRSNILIKNGWRKRKGQYYIQTWHGSLGIKKIDQTANDNFKVINKTFCKLAQTDSAYTDILLSNSTFEDEVFKTGFWYNGKVAKFGHPRNDIFFYDEEEQNKIKEKIFENLKIPKDKKVILYVPSFRDDKKLNCYNLDTQLLIKAFVDKFEKDCVVAIRMHPHLKAQASNIFNFDNDLIVDASLYPDIQELLVASDVAITDYSSCIFDFMLSRKPAFIFATDIEEYNNDRGFYYPLESTPFPVARNEELCENIKNFDYEKYKKEVEEFLKEKGCIEDGHASERVVDLIERIMNE